METPLLSCKKLKIYENLKQRIIGHYVTDATWFDLIIGESSKERHYSSEYIVVKDMKFLRRLLNHLTSLSMNNIEIKERFFKDESFDDIKELIGEYKGRNNKAISNLCESWAEYLIENKILSHEEIDNTLLFLYGIRRTATMQVIRKYQYKDPSIGQTIKAFIDL
jgi:hypothetical protein